MSHIPFNSSETENPEVMPNPFFPDAPGYMLFRYPISCRESYEGLRNGNCAWMPYGTETSLFCPRIIPDNIARGFVIEQKPFPMEKFGGPDMFGVQWVYVPIDAGSMEDPNIPPLLNDANDWKEVLRFPDIDSWDWEGSARENMKFLDNDKANMFWLLNGAGFERLISFMGFQNAAVALIDDEQTDALKEMLQSVTNLIIRIVNKACDTYGSGISGFTYHDDWGSQMAPFFSHDVAEDIFVPYMKQITDAIHARGKIADLHSCGHIETQIDNLIKGGWDMWTPMAMNDTHALYENYGDKIIIGVTDEPLPEGCSEEEQYARGRAIGEKYFSQEKPSIFSMYSAGNLTPAYTKGLYEGSRQH